MFPRAIAGNSPPGNSAPDRAPGAPVPTRHTPRVPAVRICRTTAMRGSIDFPDTTDLIGQNQNRLANLGF